MIAFFKAVKTKVIGFFVILVVSGCLFTVLLNWRPKVISEFENRTWDWRLKLISNSKQADQNIKIIVVDQASLDFFDREYSLTWPLPRDAYLYVVEFLAHAKAKGLAFDILFTESSAQAVETDVLFAESIKTTNLPVVTALSLENYEKYISEKKLEIFKARQLSDSNAQKFIEDYQLTNKIPNFQSATLPIIELLEQSPAFGAVQATPDSDGVFRHYVPVGKVFDFPVLSLPFALYNLVNKNSAPFNLSEYLDGKGRLTIFPRGASGSYETISLAAVIQSQAEIREGKVPKLNPNTFKDSWVILGVTAAGLLDLRPTSLEPRGNGVELVATVLDNLLHQNFVKHLSKYSIFLLGMFFVIIILITIFSTSLLGSQIILFNFIYFCFFSITLYAATFALWIPVIIPTIIFAISTIVSLGFQYQVEGKQKKFIRSAFSLYVSPSVVEQVVVDPTLLALGGEKKELTIFFSDIVSFTSISEKMEGGKLIKLLNEYLTLFTDIIQETNGTVDKYIGDGVMAFWNAPLDITNHAECALKSAIKCQLELERVESYFAKTYGASMKTRIGLNTDFVRVGNFGSKNRFNYTVIGDGANLASRLEGANKFFGTNILLAESTYRLAENVTKFRKVASIQVIGKAQPINVFEPLINNKQFIFQNENLAIFNSAIDYFENKELIKAKEILLKLSFDPVSQVYLKRIERDIFQSLEDWSFIWKLNEK